ncbi:MAG: hypothetical protein AAF441_19990 [Pseudomonadota bacterium]
MSETTKPRAAESGDELRFQDFHEPALTSGSYKIKVDQELVARAGARVKGSTTINLAVGGPQLQLPPDNVVTTFPANLSSGRFFAVLPHITLARSTLPWERDPQAGGASTGAPRTWLVLLVLSEDELKLCVQRTVDAGKLPAPIPHKLADPKDRVHVIDVPRAMLATHFPTLNDLEWLAHVRAVRPAPVGGKAQPVEDETATVIGSRLPVPGKQNHAFLISVEHRYRSQSPSATAGARTPFVVLHQWSFYCEDTHPHGFVELLKAAVGPTQTPEPLSLGTAPAETPESQGRLDAGFVPMVHRFRNGDRSAAWYHGPLLPGAPPLKHSLIESRLPASNADALLFLDEEFAMLDVSYAAAWQLGRLLALEHTDIATSIYQWKRARARAGLQASRPKSAAASPHVLTAPAEADFPAITWFQVGLMELRDVPFSYLVPDEAMLPPSSFRFFDIDRNWLECLRDGALSVGRTDSRAREIELIWRKNLPRPDRMSGFLLRSQAVTDWPGLEVDGYAKPGAGARQFGGSALDILRMERLSKSVLLVLFKGRAEVVDIHLHPQAVHFGFAVESTSGHEILSKERRGGGANSKITLGVSAPSGTSLDLQIDPSRRIDMAALAGALGIRKASGKDGHVAEFALQMLDGVPMVRFSRVPGAGT